MTSCGSSTNGDRYDLENTTLRYPHDLDENGLDQNRLDGNGLDQNRLDRGRLDENSAVAAKRSGHGSPGAEHEPPGSRSATSLDSQRSPRR